MKSSRLKLNVIMLTGLAVLFVLTPGCKKEETDIPVITSAEVSNIDVTSAVCGGTITSSKGSLVTARGVCWSSSPDPTITDDTTFDGTDMGSFISTLTGLDPDTTYYVKAYATNKNGTAYGDMKTFTTLEGMVDIEGNVYHTVTMGSNTWTVENLKVTRYNDGTPIAYQPNSAGGADPIYCWYGNDESNKEIYGALYNWYAVNTGKLAPVGWHVPIFDERIRSDGNGGDYKEIGTVHWKEPNSDATNSTGFTALPGGAYWFETYRYMGERGYWWLTKEYGYEAFCIYIDYMAGGGVFNPLMPKYNCLSVRCVKDY